MSRAIFDPLCGELEDFFNGNSQEVLSNRVEEMERIFAPIVSLYGSQPSSGVAFSALRDSFSAAENRLAELCRTRNLDDLMAILRRAPVCVMGSDNWLAYLSLGLVKYTNPTLNTTADVSTDKNQYTMAHVWTSDLLFDADRIANAARAMEDICGAMRWVGKGAQFSPMASNPLHCKVGDRVKKAVDLYEARRPDALFREQGIMTSESKGEQKILIFCIVGKGAETILRESKRELSLYVNFAPSYFELNPVLRVLEAYRDPIMDLFGVRPEAIAQVLGGLSGNVWHTLLWPKSVYESSNHDSFTLNLAPDDGSADYAHKLDFTFRLLRTGYLRFPREHWISALGSISSPWADTKTRRQELVEEFLNAFTILPERRDQFDLSVLRPYPLVSQAPSGQIYFDLRGIPDFLRDLVEAGKLWFSSQHGDRFTLSLKSKIETQTPNATVVGWKTKVRNRIGGKTECDLLVKARGRLYVIECKALSHSDRFFRGDPDAVRQLGSRLASAYKQAKAAAEAVKHEASLSDSHLDGTLAVEFCVCTPSQQYICPCDKFGWLHDGVPRVCTPEELISIL